MQRNPSTCISDNSKFLKSIADTSVIESDEIITVMDIASAKKDKFHSKKCYKYCFNKLS